MKNEYKKKPKDKESLAFNTIIPIGTISSMFFITARFIHIPSGFTDIEIPFQYAILGTFAIAFGSIPGAIAGFCGQLLVCLCHETHFMISTLITTTSIGIITGLFRKYSNARNGSMTLKDYFIFPLATLVTHITALFIIRPAAFLLIHRHITEGYFRIALKFLLVNTLTTSILGSIIGFIFAYIFKNYKIENI